MNPGCLDYVLFEEVQTCVQVQCVHRFMSHNLQPVPVTPVAYILQFSPYLCSTLVMRMEWHGSTTKLDIFKHGRSERKWVGTYVIESLWA